MRKWRFGGKIARSGDYRYLGWEKEILGDYSVPFWVEVVAETMHMGEIACGETRIRTEAACIGARERKQASLPPGGAVSTVECSPERNIECCPRD